MTIVGGMRTPRPLPDLPTDVALSRISILGCGVCPAQLRTAVADGRVTRIAHDRYLPATPDDPWDLLRAKTRAFLDTSPAGAIAAGWSAIALHRLPTATTPPPMPTVIRQRPGYHGSDRSTWGHTRYCLVPEENLTAVAGTPVVSPGFAACDIARSAGLLPSLMAADAVAATPYGRQEMVAAIEAMRRWPRHPRAAWIAGHCDGYAESPLETAGRYAAIVGGVELPVSNAWLGPGWPRARVDHWWHHHGVAGEGDGALKYRHNAAAVIAAERRRQADVEMLGVAFVRYDWQLAVRQRRLLAARFEAALAAPARAMSRDLRWWTCAEGWALIRGEKTLDECPGRIVGQSPRAGSG